MTDVVQSFYDRWARAYDAVADLPPVAGWRDRTAASLGLDPGDTVVEMGCGTGANLPYLREHVGPHGTVVGIDLTRGMLRRARKRNREPGGLVQADATRPPIGRPGGRGDGAIDALLGSFVVGLFSDPVAVVDDWCDLVGPGGHVGLLHFHASDRWWARPANLGYAGLVRVSSPNAVRAAGAAAAHDASVRQAHDALEGRADDIVERDFGGGFLRLQVGRIGED